MRQPSACGTSRAVRRCRFAAVAVISSLIVGTVLCVGKVRHPTGPASGEIAPAQVAAMRPAAGRATIRVGSFNINSGTGQDHRFDLGRIAASIRDVDFVGLYEVGGALFGSPANQAEDLGRRTGMTAVFAPQERQWWHDSFGNGLLTRVPVTEWRRIPLTDAQGRSNMLLARVPLAGRTVTVLMTHIDPGQIHAIATLFLSLERPAILMGDLNVTASNPYIAKLLAEPDVRDPFREKIGGGGEGRVDWILTRGMNTVNAGIVDNKSSDHPFLWAELGIAPLPENRTMR